MSISTSISKPMLISPLKGPFIGKLPFSKNPQGGPWKPGPPQAVNTWESPRFPLKGPFKGEVDTGIDIDVDMDIDSDVAVSTHYGSFQRGLGFLSRGLGLI